MPIDRVSERRQLRRWNPGFLIRQHGLRIPQVGAGVESRPVVRRIARNQAVEIIGVALRFHQALLAALGAADIIGVGGRLSIESFGQRLAVARGQMQRAMAEIGYEVGPAGSPGGIEGDRAGLMAGVGARRGVTAPQGPRHRRITDRARHAAIADALILAVPIRKRQPDFKTNRRLGNARDPAEGRVLHGAVRARRGKCVFGLYFSTG